MPARTSATVGGSGTNSARNVSAVPNIKKLLFDAKRNCRFVMTAPGTFGNLERGSLHGPGFAQIDMVVAKHIPFGGQRNAEFRVEVFNLFDHANYASLTNNLASASYLTPVRDANVAYAPRMVQLGFRFEF